MKFNLSKFKKISEGEDHTVLKHPEGHTIQIDHTKLHPGMKAQLKKLPLAMEEGGQVPSQEQPLDMMPNAPQQQAQPNENDQRFQTLQASMQGKPVFDQNLGTMVFPNEQRYGDAVTNASLTQLRTDAEKQSNERQAATQEAVSHIQNQKLQAAKQLEQYKKAGVSAPQELVDQASVKIPVEEGAQMAGVPSQAQQLSNIALTAPVQTAQAPGTEAALAGYYNPYTAEANAAIRQTRDLEALKGHVATSYQQVQGELANTMKDIQANHINPAQYLESQDIAHKVTTAIGLVLGGMGGALAHQENPALKFLNSQIERNVQAQVAGMQSKQNLLGAQLNQLGNIKDATEMNMAIQNGLLAAKFQEAASRLNDPFQKMKAMEMVQYYQNRANGHAQGVAARSGARNASQGGVNPAIMINFMVPKERQAEAFKELQSMQELGAARNEAMDAFNQLSTINTPAGKLNPQSYQRISALRDPVVLKLARDAAGRVNEYELPGIIALFPSAVDNDATLKLKRNKLEAFLQQKMHAPILDGFGINYKPQMSAGTPNAKVNPGYK